VGDLSERPVTNVCCTDKSTMRAHGDCTWQFCVFLHRIVTKRFAVFSLSDFQTCALSDVQYRVRSCLLRRLTE